MKVLLLARSTLRSQPGGDTLQIDQTAAYLRKLGCTVDVALRGKKLRVKDYDIIHFFNLFRPADLLPYLPRIKKLVVTTIYVDYKEYDGKHRGALWRNAYRWFGKFGVEYLKTCMRWLKGKEHFPGWYFLLNGQAAAVGKILKRADFCITASYQEAQVIESDCPSFNPKKYKKISLGCEHFEPETFKGTKRDVACAARIEGIKNQLRLIKAAKGLDVELHLFGNSAANQQPYLKECEKMAGEKIRFEGFKLTTDLAKLLPKFKVHAMPSYYETTGISTIEALKSGCQAVITRRGAQEEIFGNHVFYCNPDSIESIRNAIKKAMTGNEDHSHWVKENFSWEKAAAEILDIYHSLYEQSESHSE